MNCYLGRFRVPYWLFAIAPPWLHRLADRTIPDQPEADEPG